MASKGKVDIAWQYCTMVGNDPRRVKCSFCGKEMSGGVARFKCHLAGIAGNVSACKEAPMQVRTEIQLILNERKRQKQTSKLREQALQEDLRARLEGVSSDDDDDEDDGGDDDNAKQLRQAIKESRRTLAEDEARRRGEGSSGGTRAATEQRGIDRRSASVRITGRDAGLRTETASRIDAFLQRTQSSKQPKIKTAMKGIKNAKQFIGKAISKFFYYNHIPFNTADTASYTQMVSAIQDAGTGIKPPTAHEISNKYLEMEVEEVSSFIETFKRFWDETGCTLMCDGWTTQNKRSIINFLVYCPMGTVFLRSVDCTTEIKNASYICNLMDEMVEEIGESRVVQVVTDNGANFKAAGQTLMRKRPLFWTPCAAHCIDLMLEDIGKVDTIKETIAQGQAITGFIYNHSWSLNLMRKETENKELVRPGITRFATHFLALQSIYVQCEALRRMCTCEEWGKRVQKMKPKDRDTAYKIYRVILGEEFWVKVGSCIGIFEPLVKVLRLVDSDDQPQMGFLHEAMDRAKESIKRNVNKTYKKWWKIIDERWGKTLQHDLHAAGYFLNPKFQYANNAMNDRDMILGLRRVISVLETDIQKQIAADKEIDIYRLRSGQFGTTKVMMAIKAMTPGQWWSTYGLEDCPTLAPIAVRILSQTVSSSQCERNWSTFSLIHTKPRNRLTTKKLEKLVFIHYNMRLKDRQLMRMARETQPIDLDRVFDDDDPLVEWIRETEDKVLDDRDNEWLDQALSEHGDRGGTSGTAGRDDDSDTGADSPGGPSGGPSGGGAAGASTSDYRYGHAADDPPYSQPQSGYSSRGGPGDTYVPDTYGMMGAYPTERDLGDPSGRLRDLGPQYQMFIPGLSGGSTPVNYRGQYHAYTISRERDATDPTGSSTSYGGYDAYGSYGRCSTVEDSSSSYGGYGSYAYGGGDIGGSSSADTGTALPFDSMMDSLFTYTELHHLYPPHPRRDDDDDEHRSLRDPPRNSTWY